MKLPVNLDIAFTHIFTRKKQTLITALGITIGVGIYLFMHSLNSGFTGFSRDNIFKNNAHIKIYKADEMSQPLFETEDGLTLIANPQITTLSKRLNNPDQLLSQLEAQPFLTNAIPVIDFSAFYSRGNTQLKGSGLGVDIMQYAEMFETEEKMVAGSIEALANNNNGIIIGSGIAKKLSLTVGQNITVTSSYGVNKILRIVGIFETGNSQLDESRSYVSIPTAQQFLKEGASFVTTIYANTIDPNQSLAYAEQLSEVVPYEVEDWTVTNRDLITQDSTRQIMMTAISFAILVLAGFGIYNILSSTISQKIDDIAILKATGFNGRDVVKIFISEALLMGVLGTLAGLILGVILITIMSNIYIGQPVGYFPIDVEPALVVQSALLGLALTLGAGYFPARKAANVDPVEIFRK